MSNFLEESILNGRLKESYHTGKFSAAKNPQHYNRVPFWVSSPNYYVLSLGVALALFFTVLWLFETSGEAALIYAGVLSSAILIFAAIFRSILLKRHRKKILRENRQAVKPKLRTEQSIAPNKLTIEKNAVILEEIEKKSKAAVVLANLPQAHLEVFEFCNEYLRKSADELKNAGFGSPRIPVLKKSRKTVKEFHKYHLLAWASLKSRLLLKDAQELTETEERLEYSAKALKILDSAAEFYPNEKVLTDSADAVRAFISGIKLNDLILTAEEEAKKQNYRNAISFYQKALSFLAGDDKRAIDDKELLTEKINGEISRLDNLVS